MKKVLYLVLLGMVVILAAVTNPSVGDHRDAVKEKVHKHLKEKFADTADDTEGSWGEIGNSLGLALGAVLLDPMVKKVIRVDNYVLFSLTRAEWEDDSNVIGVGLFGHVFLSPKMDEKLEEVVEENF